MVESGEVGLSKKVGRSKLSWTNYIEQGELY